MKRMKTWLTVVLAVLLLAAWGGSALASAKKSPLPALAAPAASLPSGDYAGLQSVTLTAPKGATIRYTTNGKTPTASSTKYSKPIPLTANTTIKAIAVRSGYTSSPVMVASYTVTLTALDAPTASVEPGEFYGAQSVKLTGPAGAAIYYTTNGKTPTIKSSKYKGTIKVTKTMTIKAIAVRTGYGNSAVFAGKYTIKPPKVATPSAGYIPADAVYPLDSKQSITIKAPASTTLYVKLDYGPKSGDISTANYTFKLAAGKASAVGIPADMTIQYLLVKSGYTNTVITRTYIFRQDSVSVMDASYIQAVLDGVNWGRTHGVMELGDGSVLDLTTNGPVTLDTRLSLICQAHAMKLAQEDNIINMPHTGFHVDETVAADDGTFGPVGMGARAPAHSTGICLPKNNLLGIGAVKSKTGMIYLVIEGCDETTLADARMVAALADAKAYLGIQ